MRVKILNLAATGQSAGEQAILEAAVKLFSESGYGAVSMRSVALEAGVSKANIYHHFESKEALYRAILDASASRLSALVNDFAENTGPFSARIAAFASAHRQHMEENALTLRLVLRESFSGDEERSKMLAQEVFGGVFNRIVAIFQAGQKAGELRPELDPALCATLLMGADVFYFQADTILKHLPQAEFAENPAGFSRQMADVMLNGMLLAGSGGEVPA